MIRLDTGMKPIGVFDSGYGGLTILKEFTKRMPEYDFIYLGDNARAPYGNRSFETIYDYTLQAVELLFSMGCELVILACNTASAKALRNIQQKYLPSAAPEKRVLGVIRPSVEKLGLLTSSDHIGILGTAGTVSSHSYPIEIAKFYPNMKVNQQPCPMLVPLVENLEIENEGSDYFVKRYCDSLISMDPLIDLVLLGCTHYPLLLPSFQKFIKPEVRIITQDTIVADSLVEYLERHSDMNKRCSKQGTRRFLTTDATELFDTRGEIFFGSPISSERVHLC